MSTNPPGIYEVIAVWRKDFKRLRDLEHLWHRSRVKVVETLLDLEKKDNLIPKSVTADQVVDFTIGQEAVKELGG